MSTSGTNNGTFFDGTTRSFHGSADLTDTLHGVAKAVTWIIALRGVLAIIFGIIALVAPAAALVGIVLVFASYLIVDGVFAIVHGVGLRGTARGWGWLVAQGVVSVITGVVALIAPEAAGAVGALVVLWTIVIFAIVNGVAGIPTALALADGSRRTVALIVAIATLAFGILLGVLILVQPVVETVLGLIWVAGVWAIIAGILLIALAVQERKLAKEFFGPLRG